MMAAASPWSTLLARRYQRLGVLGRGATGTVHRALDRLSGQRVALKSVSADHEGANADAEPISARRLIAWQRSPKAPDLLEREFKLLAGLRHPNIITTLDYGRDESAGPFFTMDLQDDARTLRAAAEGQSPASTIELLVQLLHALAYLHRRGLAHGDLKPENALCTRGVLKLLDLGLATPIGTGAGDGAGGGTLAYAAPELVRGAAPSVRSDLYAFGVLTYELLAGRVPFDASSPARLLQALFNSSPSFDRPEIPARLVPVLRRLLARDPAERYGDALEVVTALSDALGQAFPLETTSTRESLLRAAGFVGRSAELERLRRMLPSEAPLPGPASVLIAGESGVGKSRLLEELAIDAMVRGVRVIRGRALREGSRPYEPWRGILRHLAVVVEPTPLEASILATVVTEISSVLGRPVPAAPELDPEATRVRLVRVLEALLRRHGEPLLLVIEDLQWAGTESLKVFARAQSFAATLPLLLVASYRDDERPSLPLELPGTMTLTLTRFTPEDIHRLCSSMLGERLAEEAGRADLAQLVHRRSEGNAFLALEVMRALAHEAGALEHVVALPLAARLLAGDGTERLVQRRVERLSPRERTFLRTAAVAGRELDADLLARIHPELDVTECAMRAVEAAVLASAQGRWWFAHDKVRDALLEEIPDDERRQIHRSIALAVLAARPDDASTLAHHFGAAGAHEREKEFAALAGTQFLRSGAYHDAVPFLRRALTLASPADPPLERATLERRLGEALFRSGQLALARASLARALALLGRPLPSSRPRLALGLLRETWTQLRLRTRHGGAPESPSSIDTFEEAIRAYTELSRLAHHLNDAELVLLVTLSALNLSERASLLAHQARLSAVMGAVMGLLPVHRWARHYFATAESLTAKLDDDHIQAFVLAHRGYYEAGIGSWRQCEDDLVRSRELYDSVGDVRLAEESISILAYALFFRGDLAQSLELYRELERSGEERVDAQITSWGAINAIKVLVRSRRLASVDDLLRRAEGLATDGITSTVRDGITIDMELVRGDLGAARDAAIAAAARLDRSPPRSFMTVSTYAAIAEAFVSACEAALATGHHAEAERLRRRATKATRALARLARVFPIAEPARLVYEGRLVALRGRTQRARQLCARAQRLAAERAMPFEEELARRALASLAAPPQATTNVSFEPDAVQSFSAE